MTLLRSLSIQRRLFLQLILVAIGLTVVVLEGLNQLHISLLDNKAASTSNLVQVAHSILEKHHNAEQQGQLTKEEAQQRAIAEISALRYDGGNYFWINDMSPTMVMHPIKPELDGQDLSNNQDADGKRLFVAMVDVVESKGEGLVPYLWPKPGEENPVDKISYVKGFAPWGWIVGSGVYIQDVDAAFWAATPTPIIFSLLVTTFVAVLSLLIDRSICRPLRTTANALNDIVTGEGDLTRRLNTSGDDEVHDLATAFNAFVEKIEGTVREVKQASSQLNDSAASLTNSMNSSLAAASDQQGESQAAATAVTEMAATVGEIAKSAEQAAASADSANDQALEGKQIVDKTVASVNKLAGQIDQACEVINNLNDNSQSISSVLGVISEIAEQTSLLALNAAIEAARAGEQGRGFAVVADEVRTLASRTQTSTEEIRKMIESLQTGSHEAVSVMESSKQASQDTVEIATGAGESLQSITESIGTINQMNTQIASAAEEQSAVAQEVDQNIVLIADLSERGSNDIREASGASEALNELSNSLQQLVNQFKVSA